MHQLETPLNIHGNLNVLTIQSDGSCRKSTFGVFVYTIIATQMSAGGMATSEIQRQANQAYKNLRPEKITSTRKERMDKIVINKNKQWPRSIDKKSNWISKITLKGPVSLYFSQN